MKGVGVERERDSHPEPTQKKLTYYYAITSLDIIRVTVF
jgi:hypothetical protein